MVAARDRFPRPRSLPVARGGRAVTGRGTIRWRARLVVDLAGGTGYYLYGWLQDIAGPASACPTCRSRHRARRPRPLPGGGSRRGRLAIPAARRPFGRPGDQHLRAAQRRRDHPRLPRRDADRRSPRRPGYLGELRRPLGTIGIDREPRRLADSYDDYTWSDVTGVTYQPSLDRADLAALVSMGSAPATQPQALAARVCLYPAHSP